MQIHMDSDKTKVQNQVIQEPLDCMIHFSTAIQLKSGSFLIVIYGSHDYVTVQTSKAHKKKKNLIHILFCMLTVFFIYLFMFNLKKPDQCSWQLMLNAIKKIKKLGRVFSVCLFSYKIWHAVASNNEIIQT